MVNSPLKRDRTVLTEHYNRGRSQCGLVSMKSKAPIELRRSLLPARSGAKNAPRIETVRSCVGELHIFYRTQMSDSILKDRDYTLILDKSGSMSAPDAPGGKSRWELAQESTLAVARKCEQFDPDGITVYTFAGRFRRYDDVTASKVEQIFLENDPMGTTDLASVLEDATNNYFQRKAAGQTKPSGETILVVTDGEPNDRKAVMRVIVEASRQMDRDEELAISFI